MFDIWRLLIFDGKHVCVSRRTFLCFWVLVDFLIYFLHKVSIETKLRDF